MTSESAAPTDSDMQLRVVELPTPEGVVRGKVSVTTGPMGLAALVPTASQLTNALVGHATNLVVLAGKSISCRAGCGACCRHMVPISPPEAIYLMDILDSFEPARRSEVMQRFDQIVEVLDERKMIDELLDPPPTDDAVLPVAREYFALGLACPLLVDESCSIHEHRPVACRDYNVTSPVKWCSAPYTHDIAKVPMPIPLSASLSRLTAKLTGEKPCLIPLTLVPRWAAAHAELRSRRWPGPELFDLFLAELTLKESGNHAE